MATYDSPAWDWGKGYCRKHRGQELPCAACIAGPDPDLVAVFPVARAEGYPGAPEFIELDQLALQQIRSFAAGFQWGMSAVPAADWRDPDAVWLETEEAWAAYGRANQPLSSSWLCRMAFFAGALQGVTAAREKSLPPTPPPG